MTSLFDPITLRGLTVRNRIWLAPMCQYSCFDQDGIPNDWHLVNLGQHATGGFGLVMTEATAVVPEGRISPEDTGIWSDAHIEPWRRIAAFVRSQGAVAGIQLAHAGRKACLERPWVDGGRRLAPDEPHGWTPVGPSAIPFSESSTVPEALTRARIGEIIQEFAAAAERALEAGFEVAEIQGAHGYLIHQFLSPYSNHRTDEYGGSFEGRTRFALEVVDAVRRVWPEDLPVFFRISATDWLAENPDDDREGWTADDTVRFAEELRAHGVDLMDVSTGANVLDAKIVRGPGYQVRFAERVRTEAGMPVAAVGLITKPAQAQEIITSGKADAVLLARELLRDPYWARRAATELGGTVRTPVQYNRARP
jgi:2,4-dienoyl-CoA reductase-like NADH-dependent reductase (Old Yellow Enzyme family)